MSDTPMHARQFQLQGVSLREFISRTGRPPKELTGVFPIDRRCEKLIPNPMKPGSHIMCGVTSVEHFIRDGADHLFTIGSQSRSGGRGGSRTAQKRSV